ncbi:MAG TPA: M1 family metallopeptidase, partial [Flavisolibacter sp.]|nr:M1 family metallopeptidase [Flavisolibacter sp.]
MMRIFLSVILIVLSVAGKAQLIDVQHYKYEIELSDASDAINGKAYVTVKFLQASPVLELDLSSGRDEKGMYVFQVKEGNTLLTSRQANDKLIITLKKPSSINEVRTFEVSYMGTPQDGLIISRNKYGERTFFADNWPNRAHNWIPCNDDPSDKATVEFVVTAPSHYRIISNGVLKEEKEVGNNIKRTHWAEDIIIPTKVMVIGAADFAVTRVDHSYHIPVTAWTYKADSARGAYDYSLGDDILHFFESYIGPYPYNKLANVESKTIFGGMENASAIFYAESSVTGDQSSEALMAHEIAHQWFGNTATEKSFSHLWLSEGFATYLTDMYIQQKYGNDSFQKRLQNERETVIKFVKNFDQPVVDTVTNLMDLLNANSYQKGAWVLHMLRNEVGDSIFKKIIRSYYNTYKFKNADTRDLQKIAEAVSGKDLKWFFDQWLYQPGIPQLKIQVKADNEDFKLEITQGKTIYKFPIEISIISKSETTHERFYIDKQVNGFKFKASGP